MDVLMSLIVTAVTEAAKFFWTKKDTSSGVELKIQDLSSGLKNQYQSITILSVTNNNGSIYLSGQTENPKIETDLANSAERTVLKGD